MPDGWRQMPVIFSNDRNDRKIAVSFRKSREVRKKNLRVKAVAVIEYLAI